MKNTLTFVLGAAVGSLVTWKLVEEKYKRLANEEIEEVREYYKGKLEPVEDLNNIKPYPIVSVIDTTEPEELVKHDEYVNVLTGLGYSEDDAKSLAEDPDVTIEKNEDGEYEVFIEPPSKTAPFVISPEEYGEIPGYDAESWTYYSDGILTNDDDEIVDNIEYYIGDALDHFGEYEDDCVHVRNENEGIECDIEILKYSMTYDEAHGGESHVNDDRE